MTAPCKKSWCACLSAPCSEYCAVHRKNQEVRPLLSQDAKETSVAANDCAECDGTGECQECDGEGTHTCEHRNCYDEHDCGECDGSGKCQECIDDDTDEPRKSDDKLYLEWANETAWQPWQMPNPWDEVTA